MPKYYCDYCDTYLTHDSPSVRKTHSIGRKHKENVREYYQKWMEEQAQRLIDQTTAAFKSGKMNPSSMFGPRFGMPPPMMGMGPPRMGMPPMGMPPGMNPFIRPPAGMTLPPPPLPGMPFPGMPGMPMMPPPGLAPPATAAALPPPQPPPQS